MLMKYYRINVEKFLKDSHLWDKEIQNAKEELSKYADRDSRKLRLEQFNIDGEIVIEEIDNTDFEGSEDTMSLVDMNDETITLIEKIRRLERYKELKDGAVRSIGVKYLDGLEAFYGPLRKNDSKTEEDRSQNQILFDHKMFEPRYKFRTMKNIEDVIKKYNLGSKQAVYDIRTNGKNYVLSYLEEHEQYNELAEFYEFEINKFLKNAAKWEIILNEYEKQIAYGRGISAISMDGTGGGRKTYHISDPTARNAIMTERTTKKMEEVEKCIDVYNRALNSLSDFQKELIEAVYRPWREIKHKERHFRLELVATNNGQTVAVAEKEFREAKRLMKKFIESKYFGR